MTYYEKKPEKKFFEKELVDYRDMVWGCARCNWCQNQWGWNVKSAEFSEICPAFHEFRIFPYSGMGKMHIARALLEGDFDYDDAPEMLDFIYTCTTCGACEMNCQRLQDKEPLKVNETLRAQFVRDGFGPKPEHKRLITGVQHYDNPWMQPRSQRDRWARTVPIKDLGREPAQTLFFVGCTAAFNNTLWKMAQSTAMILHEAGIDLGMFGKQEICCGSPIARIGDRETFFTIARRNIDLIHTSGVRQIITFCPGCYRSLKYDYPEVPGLPKLKPAVYHAAEYIAQLIDEERITCHNTVPLKVTWHDPCHLGRHCGIYEAPRRILRAIPGIELIEMERIKDQAWCCGGGGGARAAYPDFARATALKRIAEAQKTGAQALVTQCPFCEQNLMDALAQVQNGMQLFDLNELVIRASQKTKK
ncbi:MAG: (Fe-S)-binding protein [Desulfobacterota bacterium]|nr:(Fe-S)-binding protein [Thermodesulfobacteriota bacterium]